MAGEENLVSIHTSLCVSCRDDMNTVLRSSDRDVNWRPPMQEQSPPVQVEEPYIDNLNSKRLLVGSPCKSTGVYYVHLPRKSVRAFGSI